jgi:hypothetical protein
MDIRNQKMGVGKKAYTHRRLPPKSIEEMELFNNYFFTVNNVNTFGKSVECR